MGIPDQADLKVSRVVQVREDCRYDALLHGMLAVGESAPLTTLLFSPQGNRGFRGNRVSESDQPSGDVIM